jgi:hypothetical protein
MVQPATVSAVAGSVLQRPTCVGRADRCAQCESDFVAPRPFRRQADSRLIRARRASRGGSAGAASTR